MPDRYSIYDTQIVEAGKDPLKSREFLPLEGIDVIAKIPVTGGVALFYKNDANNIVYGKFTLQPNETYSGSAVAISEEVEFTTDDIFILNGYYDQDESFYVFYNDSNNIYVRTFLTKQGFLGQENVVVEDAQITKINRIKENFFMVIEDLSKTSTINEISELSNGELKLFSLFENDIIKLEAGIDEILRTQTIVSPFGDIGEEKWSCDNLVNNEQGFLYLTGDNVRLQDDEKTINGFSFINVTTAYMEMNSSSDEYTLMLRCKIRNSGSWVSVITTNNIKLEIGKSGLGEQFRFTFPDGSQQTLSTDSITEDINSRLYKNITITTKEVNEKRITSFYLDLNRNEDNVLVKIIDDSALTGYSNDSLAIIENIVSFDYLSLQNYALSKKSIHDMHKAFNKDLIKSTKTGSQTVNQDDLNNYIIYKQTEFENLSLFSIPSDAVVAENDYRGDYADSDKTYWLCEDVAINGDNAENLILFMETGSTFVNGISQTGTIYAKTGTFVNLNNASEFIVYYESGADVYNQGRSTLILVDNMAFNYDNAPSNGCPDPEDLYRKQVTSFPIFPSNLVVSEMDVLCKGSLYYDSRFLDNGDGTLTDLQNYLMWKKAPIQVTQNNTNKQNEAYRQARTYEFANHSDWRLPTKDELDNITDFYSLYSTCISGYVSAYGVTGAPGQIGITGVAYSDCASGAPVVQTTDTVFDFIPYATNYDTDLTCWTSTSQSGIEGTGSENFYSYDFFNKTSTLSSPTSANYMGMYVRDASYSLMIVYDDGTEYVIPSNAGGSLKIIKQGTPELKRPEGTFEYNSYTVEFNYEEIVEEMANLPYTKNYKLNSTREYEIGQYLFLDRESINNDLLDTVLPIFLDQDTQIPKSIFVEPEENIRICENLTQKYAPTPFIINYDNKTDGITLWVKMSGFRNQMGVQYGLKNSHLITPTYTDYETLSSQTYSQDGYYCAYHFDKLLDLRRLLVTDITVDVGGEILLGGVTSQNTYLREVTAINFFDKPKKYKTSEIDVEIDVANTNDRESYINNYESIRSFVSSILKEWKPATINVRSIVERNTLVMADLLKDEFTQTLVGITPRQNANTYYIRSVDTGEISILSSASRFADEIDWIGVGRINTPYVKAGVTRIKRSVKNVKVPFETRFANTIYRVFVFSPNDSKYYVTQKDRDGFIVESSGLVETEISWIALNTNQIINGTINWRRGVPETEAIVDHLDRITEINENSSKYTLSFTALGYPQFINTNYSVILSSDSNVNLWVEDKTPGTCSIRRSYAGNDTKVDFMVVEASTRWWKELTG